MRTFAEIKTDVDAAVKSRDAITSPHLATELHVLATPEAHALENWVLGFAAYCTGEIPQALEYNQRALDMYTEMDNSAGVANTTNSIASVLVRVGDMSQALESYQRVLAMYTKMGNRAGIAQATGNIGTVLVSTGNYPVAFEYFRRALATHTEVGNSADVAIVTNNIGIIYRITGDYPQALEHHQRALDMFAELGNNTGVAVVTGSIGNIHEAAGDFQQALAFQQRSLDMHAAIDNQDGVARATTNIGSVHSRTGNYSKALECFQNALSIHVAMGDSSSIVNVTVNILSALLDSGAVEEARTTLNSFETMHIDDPSVTCTREQYRARLQELDGNLDGAAHTLIASLSIALKHNLRQIQAETHKRLRDIAQKRTDFAGYIDHNDEYTRVAEEINGKETTIKLAMQVKERELSEKDKEHAKHMAVLHSTLPKHIADRVARGEVVNDHYDNAAVLFLDIVGFTTLSSEMEAREVVELLDRMFAICDRVMNTHGLMKIKTIGDSYMAASFDNVESAALAALDLVASITEVQVRIGIHCGSVVAGVLGKERMQYDVWGDTVNIASRMENTSEPGRIHISSGFALALHGETAEQRNGEQEFYTVVERGEIDVKGKGMMTTYWLEPA